MDEETTIIERDLDNFPCPTEEELKKFLNDFHYLNKSRIAFELMILTGARVGEVVKANIDQFGEDLSYWKYRIQKPLITIVYDKKKDKVNIIKDYKVRTVQLPQFFQEKLKTYIERNKYSMDLGYLFYTRLHKTPHILPSQLRTVLVKKRRKLNLKRIWKIVVKENGDIQQWYTLSCHSLRRWYVSEMFNKLVKHGVQNALTMIGKMLGHSLPLKTTSLYLSPRAVSKFIPKTYDPEFLQEKATT